MSASKRLLIIGGLALGIWAMGFGLYYAVFIEHQTLDQIGSSLTSGFTFAAQRHLPEAQAALAASAQGTYVYVRQVDAHGHWIGLAMLLIVLGAAIHPRPWPLRRRGDLPARRAPGNLEPRRRP